MAACRGGAAAGLRSPALSDPGVGVHARWHSLGRAAMEAHNQRLKASLGRHVVVALPTRDRATLQTEPPAQLLLRESAPRGTRKSKPAQAGGGMPREAVEGRARATSLF